MREMHQLQVLNLTRNRLQELPSGLSELSNLQELTLAGNQLKEFNVLIGRMPRLQKLSFDWFTYLIPPQPEIITKTTRFKYESQRESPKEAGGPGRTKSVSKRLATGSENPQILPRQISLPPSRNDSRLSGARMNSEEGMRIPSEYHSHSRPSLDLFGELARLTEKYCSVHNVHQRRSDGHRNLDFMTFTKHFFDLQQPGSKQDRINLLDSKKRTMLHYAASKGDLTVVKALIAENADKNKID